MDVPITTPAESGFAAPYLKCLRRDVPFHVFIAAYAVVGLLVGIAAGVPHKFVPLNYIGFVAHTVLPQVLFAILLVLGLRSLIARSPLQALLTDLGKVFGPQTIAGLVLFASLTFFMGVFTSIKTMLTDVVPFFADEALADLDRWLHGQDPWLYATAILPLPLLPALELLYFLGWVLLLSGSSLAVLLIPKLRHVRTQYIWASLITWSLLGNVVAGTLLSAGPTFFELVTGDPRFQGLVSHLVQHSAYHEVARAMAWRIHSGAETGTGIAISAFPSLHVAQATLLVLLARRTHRWLLALALCFFAAILFGSVYLGWHYAVDSYFSIVATLLIWRAIGWALTRR